VLEIISREAAINKGLKRYYTGIPCKHGHNSERYVAGKGCVQCNLLTVRLQRHSDPDAYNLYQREYAEQNRSMQAVYNRRSAVKNAEVRKSLEAKRNASKMNRTPQWADLKKINLVYKNCPKGMHVDHIIPLQGKLVSGLHVHNNLQYLTPVENAKKETVMLSELKFVMGSIAKKEFIPALTHFAIENGTVRGYNGVLAICSPIAFDIKCNPKADPLIRAIGNCEDTVQMSMTPGGRLSIKSGKFKAFIDCVDGDTPHVMPSGEHVAIDGAALLQAFKVIYPVIGDDASRPWSNGVLLLGQSAFATNNVVLVEYWTGAEVPHPINVPRAAIKEMLRVNEPPTSIQMDANSITFHYSENRWIRTQLLETKWPDLRKVLDRPSDAKPVDERIFAAMDVIKPFCDKMGRVFFQPGRVCTHTDESEGAGYEIEGFDHSGVYAFDMLQSIRDVVKTVDWSAYPNPCMFFGERLRGAIIGMKQ